MGFAAHNSGGQIRLGLSATVASAVLYSAVVLLGLGPAFPFAQGREAVRTDKECRFRLEGLVPGMKFSLTLRHGGSYLVGEPRIGLKEVAAGKTLDLGDVRVKPQ